MDDATARSTESVYVVRDDVSPATITSSLQALLVTRHHAIARHRFTVLDTFDGRVARAGARLTTSADDGSMKWSWHPRGGANCLEIRTSTPAHFAWDLPDGPFQNLLSSVVGVRRLFSRAEAERYGSLLDVLDQRAKTVARVRIESGRARLPLSPDGWQSVPTTITVAPLRGFQQEYEQLVPVIESRPGVERCPTGPDAVILRAIGAPEPFDASAMHLDLTASIAAERGLRQIHRALVAMITANEPGMRGNLDAEFLHDFRVAVRRTRSLLGQVKHVFPAEVVTHFSAEFSWLGRLTGPPRDMDVLVHDLRLQPQDVPADDVTTLTAAMAEMQQQEHDRLVDALDSERYRRLISDWRAFLEQPTAHGPEAINAERPLVQVIARRAWTLSRRLSRHAATIDDRTEAAHLHELRIVAKKLRYLVDVTPASDAAGDHDHILTGLKRLQRALGDFNDAEVQARRLLECGRALGVERVSASALIAAGLLSERARHRGERLRPVVARELVRFCGDDMRAACRRAFKRRSRTEALA
jgi:CHAD domain-containing protein